MAFDPSVPVSLGGRLFSHFLRATRRLHFTNARGRHSRVKHVKLNVHWCCWCRWTPFRSHIHMHKHTHTGIIAIIMESLDITPGEQNFSHLPQPYAVLYAQEGCEARCFVIRKCDSIMTVMARGQTITGLPSQRIHREGVSKDNFTLVRSLPCFCSICFDHIRVPSAKRKPRVVKGCWLQCSETVAEPPLSWPRAREPRRAGARHRSLWTNKHFKSRSTRPWKGVVFKGEG